MTGRGALEVHLYGTRIATLQDAGDLPPLTFTAAAIERWGLGSRVVANKLPIAEQPPHPRVVAAVLAGLLPEGRERARQAERAGVPADDLFGMLSHYGRDTIGALDIRRPGEPDDAGSLRPVSDREIRELLLSDPQVSAAIYGRDSRTSLPGLQPKVGVTMTPDGWALPQGGALSTHIVKLAAPQGSVAADVVHTEAAALELARLAGLDAPRAWITDFDGATTIVIERFDRVAGGQGTLRVHQEDGAQALGINTDDPERKFQRGGRVLPSWRALAQVLTDAGTDPAGLLEVVAFKHAVGDIDAHAKNIAFLRLEDGTAKVAPVYDTAMHLHAAGHDGHSAIEVNGKSAILDVGAQDLIAEARSWGIPPSRASRTVRQAVDGLRGALHDIDRGQHPGVSNLAWQVVEARADELSSQLSSRSGGRTPRRPR
ncbi:MAG: type II toxin-antitoxin system HipA family toxin [Georgenia sp.]